MRFDRWLIEAVLAHNRVRYVGVRGATVAAGSALVGTLPAQLDVYR